MRITVRPSHYGGKLIPRFFPCSILAKLELLFLLQLIAPLSSGFTCIANLQLPVELSVQSQSQFVLPSQPATSTLDSNLPAQHPALKQPSPSSLFILPPQIRDLNYPHLPIQSSVSAPVSNLSTQLLIDSGFVNKTLKLAQRCHVCSLDPENLVIMKATSCKWERNMDRFI